jgi:predicted RNA methylase
MTEIFMNNIISNFENYANFNNKRIKFFDFDFYNSNNFEKMKNYFNILNNDKSHFVNSNDICTPIECIKEMVDIIPDEFWAQKGLKILDCCAGNGNFHAYISTKTSIENLYFNEINEKRIENIKKYFGNNINLTRKDFLDFDNKKEYDLVVANPPFAKFNGNSRVSKNHNLARDFIKKALDVTKYRGYILFIVPNNWMSFSDRNILPNELSQYQFMHLNIGGAKKYFSKVGSSFTWFLLQKIPNNKVFKIENFYIKNDIQIAKLDKNVNFIPLYYSEIVRNIINKTLNNKSLPKYKIETNSFLHRYTKKNNINDRKNNEFCYKLIHTPSQTVWSNIPHKIQNGYKVFISLSNQYMTFIDNCGMTQSIAYIRCNSKSEAKKIKNELDNEIYKFLNNITRYGNFNNIRVLQKFPTFGSFKLTEKEILFIKEFNRKYYAKKEK